jgi:threonylcarbamoyladenosine tRNA methylthiotransferase MtaB
MTRKLDILTFGCRLNSYESEVMRAHAEAAGLDDAIIVNTCAVTAEAERQARQAVRKAKRDRPEARIVVTGCAAQIDPARWAAMPEVDRVLGNDAKLKAETWTEASFSGPEAVRVAVNDIQAVREQAGHLVAGFDGRARAFVQVQNGCDHRCTFCIIPYGRGPSRSVAIGEVVAQARALVAAGFRELVLTGVDITSYGSDLPGQPKLGQLVRRLLRTVPELDRLRLSSIDPVEIDDELWTAFAEEARLMPHLHLSIQAGDDLVLKRMKRRHLRADVLRTVERARSLRADAVFGADLIAGFPTEDDAMFANTLALVDEADLVHLHVFPYSARSGTPAARMPQLPVALRRARAALLRAAGERRLGAFLASRVGRTERVLVETEDGRGHSEQFAPALVQGGKPGEIVEASCEGVEDGRLCLKPSRCAEAA